MKKIIAFILFNTLLYAVTKPLIFDKKIRGNASISTEYTYTFESELALSIPKISCKCSDSNIEFRIDDYPYKSPSSMTIYADKTSKHKLTFSCKGSYVLKVDSPTELYTGGEYFSSYLGPISLITRGKFLSQVTNSHTNNLESLVPGQTNIIPFGSAGNAILSSRDTGYAFGRCEDSLFEYGMINDASTSSYWWTTSGKNFFSANCSNYFKFTKPISAFGFYATDQEDVLYISIAHVDGTSSRFRINKYMNFNFERYQRPRYYTRFVGIVTRRLSKAIKSISISVRYQGLFDMSPTSIGTADFDDFIVVNPAYIRDGDMDGDGVVNSKDPFPLNSSENVDTDHDGIGNNADKDDDNDGISDILEKHYHLNPLDPNDAGKDADADGFSNVIEIVLGFNPYSKNSHPKWAPIMMNDITMFVPYK